MDDTTQTLRQPTGYSSKRRSSTAGKVDAAMSSQVLPQEACSISVPSTELHHAKACCSFQDIVSRSVKSL